MGTNRKNATVTQLQDGRFLIVGGVLSPGAVEGVPTAYLASAEIYDPNTCQFTPTGSLTTGGRALHTATLLPDGKVLVAGGYRGEGGSYGLATAEIYDPATGKFTATGSLYYGRGQHTATLLEVSDLPAIEGKVLIVGGYNDSSKVDVRCAEIYDPASGTFTLDDCMPTRRNGHRATLLQTGSVLITGGYDPNNIQATALVWSSDDGTLPGNFQSTTGPMTTPRASHTSTLLPDGKVLLTGGSGSAPDPPTTPALSLTEIYNHATGLFTTGPSLITARQHHSAVLLPDGNVLVAGGNNNTDYGFHWRFGGTQAQKDQFLASVELFDPAGPSFTNLPSMNTGRSHFELGLLANGDVLATAGGYASAELYSEDSDQDGICDACDNCPNSSNAAQSDTDGDGVGDVCDNCGDIVNSDQSDFDKDNIGDVCDDTAMGEDPDDKPAAVPDAQPSYAPGTPINLVITVTLKPVDLDGDGDLDDTYYVIPNAYNTILRLFDCQGMELIAERILCGPPCLIADPEFVTDSNLVLVTVADGPVSYPVTFPLSEWFPNLGEGCYIAEAQYVNYCKYLGPFNQDGSCPSDDPADCFGTIYQGVSDADSQSFTVGSDQCPGIEGDAGGTGCPVADLNTVVLHTVNLGGGPSTKEPLGGVDVRVFDRNSPDFQFVAGGKNPDSSMYGILFDLAVSNPAGVGLVGACQTDASGMCYAGEKQTGDYLVIIRYNDIGTGKTVYVGRSKGPGDFDKNGIAKKLFQILKVFRKGVFLEFRGGKKILVTGSLLEVITPESAIWEGTQSVYPFIFISDSDWTVDVCANVPEGYDIVGVYDENGELIPSADCIQTFVTNESKTVAFEVQEIGSPEPRLDATLDIEHGKKKVKEKITASDIRKKSFEAKIKYLKDKIKSKIKKDKK
jgi:hypothetical protein